MSKKIARLISIILSILGYLTAIYFGGYWLLARPIYWLVTGLSAGTLTRHILIVCIIKIFLSATVAGGCWTLCDIIAGFFRDYANGREE